MKKMQLGDALADLEKTLAEVTKATQDLQSSLRPPESDEERRQEFIEFLAEGMYEQMGGDLSIPERKTNLWNTCLQAATLEAEQHPEAIEQFWERRLEMSAELGDPDAKTSQIMANLREIFDNLD